MFLVPLKLFAFLSKRPMVGNCVAPSCFRRQCAGPCRTAAACGRVRTRGTWFRRASVRRPGCGWRRARGIRTPCYLGQIASPAIRGQDGSRARTEDHPTGLCEAGHGGRRRRRSASRGGLRRGGAGGLPRTRPLAFIRTGSTTGRSSCWTGQQAFWKAAVAHAHVGKESSRRSRCPSDGGPMVESISLQRRVFAAPSSSFFFQLSRWFGCTPNSLASSAIVRSPLTAASATFALNPALCFFRVRFMSCSRAICAF